MYKVLTIGLVLVGLLTQWSGCAQATSDTETPALAGSPPPVESSPVVAPVADEKTSVGPVPRVLRKAANLSPFYKKHIDCAGLPVLASEAVRDAALVRACIDHVASHGGRRVWCNARVSAAPFYEALGFRSKGPDFEVKDIGPHRVMAREVRA